MFLTFHLLLHSSSNGFRIALAAQCHDQIGGRCRGDFLDAGKGIAANFGDRLFNRLLPFSEICASAVASRRIKLFFDFGFGCLNNPRGLRARITQRFVIGGFS